MCVGVAPGCAAQRFPPTQPARVRGGGAESSGSGGEREGWAAEGARSRGRNRRDEPPANGQLSARGDLQILRCRWICRPPPSESTPHTAGASHWGPPLKRAAPCTPQPRLPPRSGQKEKQRRRMERAEGGREGWAAVTAEFGRRGWDSTTSAERILQSAPPARLVHREWMRQQVLSGESPAHR